MGLPAAGGGGEEKARYEIQLSSVNGLRVDDRTVSTHPQGVAGGRVNAMWMLAHRSQPTVLQVPDHVCMLSATIYTCIQTCCAAPAKHP
jgi:hypothetical protein